VLGPSSVMVVVIVLELPVQVVVGAVVAVASTEEGPIEMVVGPVKVNTNVVVQVVEFAGYDVAGVLGVDSAP